jgi:SAM-dependent methyltransferase
MSQVTVGIAKRIMRFAEAYPTDPRDDVGGLSEVFDHALFTSGSEADRERIMRLSAESRYEDEMAFPWDNYFGRSVKPWVRGDALDLGCFTGGRAVAWAERYEPRSVAGLDVDRVFIEAARRFAELRNRPADFRTGSGEAIPWPDDSFDTILSFDVLEHVRSVSETLAECRRVLRPGGHLLVVFPSYFQPLEHHLGLVTRMPGLQYMFTGRTLIQAYCQILRERGAVAGWYGRVEALEPWERGNTINGTTAHRFARLIGGEDWRIVLHPRLPIGGVGRRAARGKGKVMARVFQPLTRIPVLREVALHRITYVLQKPPANPRGAPNSTFTGDTFAATSR